MSRTWNYDCRRAPRGVRLMLLLTDGEIKYSVLDETNASNIKAWAYGGESSANAQKDNNDAALARIEARLARIESRNVQMMFHLGLDAHERIYDRPNKHTENTRQSTQGDDVTTDD